MQILRLRRSRNDRAITYLIGLNCPVRDRLRKFCTMRSKPELLRRRGWFWSAVVFGLQFTVLLTVNRGWGQPSSPDKRNVPPLLGRELVFAVAYDQATRDGIVTYLEIGRAEFRADQTVHVTRFVFYPNRNPPPVPTAQPEPYLGKGCSSQRIRRPSYQRSDEFQGTWDLKGDLLVLSTRDGRNQPATQDWRLVKSDKKLFGLTASSGKTTGSFHGYAYVSEQTTVVPPVTVAAHFRPAYSGEIHQRLIRGAAAGWKRYPFGFVFSQYKKYSANIYGMHYTGDGGKTYGFSTLLFNAFRYSGNIFVQTFGTDFNRNGCFDDGGHSALYWSAEDKNGMVRGAVMVEQSHGESNTIISVGQVD